MLNLVEVISKVRTELMGIAVIAVFFTHISCWVDFPEWWNRLLTGIPVDWVYTEGFLFLSGFGVYFSLEKNKDIYAFYKKRIKRVYLPYLVISAPFISIITFFNGEGIVIWLTRLTTLNYWIEGNFASLWYVPVTLLMYLLSPLLYRLMKTKLGYVYWVIVFALTLLFLDVWIRQIDKSIYDDYKFVTQIPCFMLGMMTAKMKECGNMANIFILGALILITPIMKLLSTVFLHFQFLPIELLRLNYLLAFTFLFASIKQYRWCHDGIPILQWLGKYSLELYMIHVLLFWTFDTLGLLTRSQSILLSILISLLICVPARKLSDKVTAGLSFSFLK